MKRYFNVKKYADRFINDFKFLFKIIKSSYGEYDLRLRENYFNLYYKGNSLAKVIFKPDNYEISIHEKFANGVHDKDLRFSRPKKSNSYNYYTLTKELLYPFLQKKHLNKMCSNVKTVNNGEEITIEQLIISYNLNREDLIIIDRQVTGPGLRQKRMDLLCLRQKKDNEYSFEVVELKLGNNPELEDKVGIQLQNYISHISQNIREWAYSYQNTYRQMKEAGLIEVPSYDEITISTEVFGQVVVFGYPGLAQPKIDALTRKYEGIKVEPFGLEIK